MTVSTDSAEAGASVSKRGVEQKKDDEEDEMLSCEIEELYQQVITTFTDKALFVCLTLLDTLPETVYQVTDLLMAI